MKAPKPIKRISEKQKAKLIGRGSFQFNSTLRRTSCNAITAGRKFRIQEEPRTSLEALCSAEDLPTHASSRSFQKCGIGRKPIKKQSERQKARLQKLASIRKDWWMDAQVSRKPLVCGICGEEIRYFEDLASDHIEPGSAKSDCETNLQPAHQLCNVIKGSQRDFKIVRGDHNWKLMYGLL